MLIPVPSRDNLSRNNLSPPIAFNLKCRPETLKRHRSLPRPVPSRLQQPRVESIEKNTLITCAAMALTVLRQIPPVCLHPSGLAPPCYPSLPKACNGRAQPSCNGREPQSPELQPNRLNWQRQDRKDNPFFNVVTPRLMESASPPAKEPPLITETSLLLKPCALIAERLHRNKPLERPMEGSNLVSHE